MSTSKKYAFAYLIIVISTFLPHIVQAQNSGAIQGVVKGASNNKPIPNVNVWIKNTTGGATTDVNGAFKLTGLSPGSKILLISSVGYHRVSRQVILKAGQTLKLSVLLKPNITELNSIHITALRPDQISEKTLQKSDVKEANPRDSGELLREVPGVDAVRRGPLGLDPVVRGLRETEVGTYLDGTRIFPAGPARMDSPLSHLDPSSIQSIQVVKGPYALTWGAGNMSAVRVQTQPLNALRNSFGGSLSSGYDSNFNALEEAASVHGKSDKFGYWVHGAWRKGQNYQSGNGTEIPADFLSRGIRGKIGYAFTPYSTVSLALGYQNQQDLDYPGRLLDAKYFHTVNSSVNWEWIPQHSVVSSVKANAYINRVDHEMYNDHKPTAQPDPNRMPPFPLNIGVKAHAYVTGGKLSAHLNLPNNWNLKVGTDIYSANRDAVRTIDRRNPGMKPPSFPLTDFMWPDATISDAGIYAKIDHHFNSKLKASGTVRTDLVSADTDTISQFFANNVATDLDASEANVSGSFTLNYLPVKHWTLGVGLGSAVRTADATERYSDRVPASKAQTSAEFVGNPSLKPERNTQGDIWINASYPVFTFSLNGFARYMSNYITITPTNLPKRLPLNPNTVYQYMNGTARFMGFDASASYRIISELIAKAGVNYLYGEDTELDEPALGVSPFSVDTGLRFESSSWPFFAEGTVHFVSKQDRVASLKGETATDGYITAELKLGATLFEGLSFQGGVKNLSDEQYVNHLNAKNPFSKEPIPEPGRVFYVDLQYNF